MRLVPETAGVVVLKPNDRNWGKNEREQSRPRKAPKKIFYRDCGVAAAPPQIEKNSGSQKGEDTRGAGSVGP